MVKITPKIRTILLTIFLLGSIVSTYAKKSPSLLSFKDAETESSYLILKKSHQDIFQDFDIEFLKLDKSNLYERITDKLNYDLESSIKQHFSNKILKEQNLKAALAVSVSADITHISCNDANDGAIDLTVTGGTAPYTYSWTGPSFSSSSEDISNLSSGNYTVVVTDADNQVATNAIPYEIINPDELSGSFTFEKISCHDRSDGKLVISASGGSGNFEYSYKSGEWVDTANISLIKEGNYTIRIRDKESTSCEKIIGTKEFLQPDILSGSISKTDVTCAGGTNGEIVISGSGGYGAYDYSIDGGNTWQVFNPNNPTDPNHGKFSSLGSNTYDVWIRDFDHTDCIQILDSNFEINILDNQKPIITHNGVENVSTDPGECFASINVAATATDNCTVGVPSGERNDGLALDAAYPIGETKIYWNVTDSNGNKAEEVTQIITVTDNEIPTITAPADVEDVTDSNSCIASNIALGSALTNDNCSVASITNDAPSKFPLGPTTVTWTVTDDAGNTATDTQIVTILDSTNPTITAPADVVDVTDSNSCTASSVVLGSATTADNCNVASVTNDAPSNFPLGPTTVTWTVTDDAGNIAIDTQIVTISDSTNPTITAPADVVDVTDSNSCIASSVVLGSATTADNCNVASVTNDAPSTFPLGPTTVIWTVTDDAGNIATDTQIVTISDSTNPTITAPADVVDVTDSNSCTASSVVLGTATTADNCNVASVTNDAPSTFPLGPTTVIWTVTDDAGNIATDTQIVTISDSTIPLIECIGDKTKTADEGACYYTVNGTEFDPKNTADNCGIASVINDFNSSSTLDGAQIPDGTTIIWTITDIASNTATCNFTVTVEDKEAPPIPTIENITGECPVIVIPPTTVDNCGEIITGTTGIADLTLYESETIFWIFTDAAGNSSEPVEQIITVKDTTAPVPDVDGTLPKLTINGCQITDISELTIPTATDACEGTIYGSLGEAFTFPFSFTGTKTIEWEYVDSNGHRSTQTQDIEIIPVTIAGGSITATYNSEQYPDQVNLAACGETISVPLNLSGEVGNIVHWEKFAENDGEWRIIPDYDNSYTATFQVGELESTYYRVLTQEGSCIEYSNDFYIRALPAGEAPTVENLGDSDYYCFGEYVNLLATSNYVVSQETIADQQGEFETGQINANDPNGWLVDGQVGGLSCGGNNAATRNWSCTGKDHKFGDITYNGVDKFVIAQGNYFETKNNGDPVYSDKNPTTLETPILDFSNSRTATLNFDQAFNFATNDIAKIEISIDGGTTYTTLRTLHAAGTGVKTWISAGTAQSTVGSNETQYNFDTDNTTISLNDYIGYERVRIKWSFTGTTNKSIWAMDNIFVSKEVLVNTDLEWTVGIGDPNEEPIEVGRTAIELNFIPESPGKHQYGGTSLINDCRTYSEEGTGLIDIYVSYAYAGEDIILTGEDCGLNVVKLNAYDNTLTANENAAKGAYPSKPANCSTCDNPGTGAIGTWSFNRQETTPSCVPEAFSNINDPNATFTGGAGTYILTWTVDGCSQNVTVTLTDCNQVDFDGENDYIDFGNNYDLSGDSNKKSFSIEVWVKPESTSGTQSIFTKRDADLSGTAKGYDLKMVNGEVSFNWDKTGSINSSPYKINANRWHHIALTHTFEGEYNLYIDGIFIKRTAGGAPGQNSFRALLGAMHKVGSLAPVNHFNGWLDEVRIWDVALTPNQLRLMMNQRIKNVGEQVEGEVIPLKISSLNWSDLAGYYRLNNIECGSVLAYYDGIINKGIKGRLKNITSTQDKTAPLPYISKLDGVWSDKNIWDKPTVWEAPNSKGINGESINWNIARISNKINSGGKNITMLGLLSESNTLSIYNPNEAQNETNSGQGLTVTHYLRLNGNFDLIGESQLVQSEGSILDAASTGFIKRDQQGTANSYNYNYWSSPVVPQGNASNSNYSVASVMFDGSSGSYLQNLNFGNPHDFADGPLRTPRKISNYWINKFNGEADEYFNWKQIGSTGTLKAGEGYTMKGTSGEESITTPQNYVFKGRPNNGTLLLPVTKDQNYLVGNPYPSAINAEQFIRDNLKDVQGATNNNNVFNGALYFWDHFGGESHNLGEYVGGYATKNLLDAVPAVATDERINATGEKGTKKPGKYIPVGQGFFINTSNDLISGNKVIDGGNVTFKNGQRAFIKETGTTSTSQFLSPEKNQKQNKQEDTRAKIRLDFKSPKGYNRQILVGVDPNATNGFDLGYDAPLNDYNVEDMFWLIDGKEYVIQGVNNFNPDQVLPIGVGIQLSGSVLIKINSLENVGEDVQIYLKDKNLNTYHNLRESEYKSIIEAGDYYKRFEIVFQQPGTDPDTSEEKPDEESGEEPTAEQPVTPEEESETPILIVDPIINNNSIEAIYLVKEHEIAIMNPNSLQINKVVLYNTLGQELEQFIQSSNNKEIRLPVREYPTAVYAIKIYSEKGEFSKNIIMMR